VWCKQAAALGQLRPEEEESWAGWLGWPAGRGLAGEQRPKRRGGKMGRERVVARREGKGERASMEGKKAQRLLGWVKVAWDGWAELGKGIGKCVYEFWMLFLEFESRRFCKFG
jgi:hypothetical protein